MVARARRALAHPPFSLPRHACLRAHEKVAVGVGCDGVHALPRELGQVAVQRQLVVQDLVRLQACAGWAWGPFARWGEGCPRGCTRARAGKTRVGFSSPSHTPRTRT